MEIRRRLDFKVIFIGLYVFLFGVYLFVGLSPAEAANYEISAEISIPKIELTSDVASLSLKDNQLETPDTIVGSFSKHPNKTLLIGHSSTVFKDLNILDVGDEIVYDDDTYIVYSREIIRKDDINMNRLLLSEEKPTIIVMTCAGEVFTDGDATHRLIIFASQV